MWRGACRDRVPLRTVAPIPVTSPQGSLAYGRGPMRAADLPVDLRGGSRYAGAGTLLATSLAASSAPVRRVLLVFEA